MTVDFKIRKFSYWTRHNNNSLRVFIRLKNMAKELNENHKIGIDIDGDGKPDIGISLKTIGMLVVIWYNIPI